MQLATYIANDNGQYSLISKSKVDKNLSMTFIQIIFGFFKVGITGLILGTVFSMLFPIYRLRKGVLGNKEETKSDGYYLTLKKYKNTHLYQLVQLLWTK